MTQPTIWPSASPVSTVARAGSPTVALTVLAVGLPLVLRHPQGLVGTAVNTALVLGALRAAQVRHLLPLILLPAVAATLGGFLFDAPILRAFVMLWPAIWLGNGALVWAVRKGRGGSLAPALAGGVALKVGIIAAGAAALTVAGHLPAGFVAPFVAMQAMTALGGGAAAGALHGALNRWSRA